MNYKHGMRRTRPYAIWSSMRARCGNPKDPAYQDYGGRGITVCKRWDDFAHFFADMGWPPKSHSIERINNDRGYEPGNCVWATRVEQNRNRRGLREITIDGVTKPLSAWVEHFAVVSYATAHQRLTKGWPATDALTIPLVTRRKGVPRGERLVAFGAERGVVFSDSEARNAA